MTGMTSGDREKLIRIIRQRARLAKSALAEREQILLNEALEMLTAEYRLHEEVHGEYIRAAQEAVAKLNEQLKHQAELLGYNPGNLPLASLSSAGYYDWRGDPQHKGAKERAMELARSRLKALRAAGIKGIEEQALAAEETLIVGGLESDDAKALVDSLPNAEALMPPLSLRDLGVKTWQPARDAARELLDAPTGADRRRKLIARAIEQNPEASDRRIAQVTGFDHKTVAKYRAGEVPATAGEAARDAGEIPAADGGRE